MKLDNVVQVRAAKTIYRDGDRCIKVFNENYSKADVLNEALNHARIEETALNVPKLFEVTTVDGKWAIVMEYIDGITLKEYIERQGSLRWKDAVYFTIQILKGLQHAHDKGIVHRDVKPQNIMLLPDGTIKVTDFGIARFARSEQRTITDKAIGSVHYISPEQARGEKTDEKADIYSVGVMLYEMLTGELPFQAESAVSVAIMQLQRDPQLPTEINGSIPKGLEQITMHAMQKTLERRYQSASEMLCDLEAFKKAPAATFDYSYFVDDSPTKFVGAVRSSTPASEAIIPEDNDDEVDEPTKSRTIPILAGIAGALILVLIVLGVMFIPPLLKGTGSEIKCPNFVGMNFEEIKKNKDYTNNFHITDEWKYNEEYGFGVVYEQSQPDGEPLKKGAKITLYVSMGQATIKVPDVRKKSESYAVPELKSKGFKTIIKEIADDEMSVPVEITIEEKRSKQIKLALIVGIVSLAIMAIVIIYLIGHDVYNLFF